MALEVRDISYKYDNERLAVQRADLTLMAGEKVVIAGANGSGKSTLLKLMAGLYRPYQGKVVVDNCRNSSSGWLLPGVGLVPANPERYFFGATVKEELAYGLENQGIKGGLQHQRIAKALEAVGLNSDFLPRNPFLLSLGEQRRVGIASVLAVEPHYLLLDEPFSNLDFRGIASLIQFFNNYAAAGNSVVISSHRAAEVADWGERLLIMEAGRLLYDGWMTAWQSDPERALMLNEAAYLRNELKLKGIMVDYTTDPEVMAEQIINALAMKEVV